ncbi:uncharacterized protein LOC118205288 [Stegodyphus dumicola]|uniref:uncharacterized protein LOC118205288 n=1 Tax=Stegodyphus dumicola TaxID=202533 RepID=UPI0015ACF2FD|nr:uncharacterized protein LOC118205288 [Stegodyphus dumicola]
MQRRAENHNVTDTFVLELFLQQLPTNVQSILASITPVTTQKAAEIADKIMEVSSAQVSVVSDSCASTSVTPNFELLKKIKSLRKEVAFLRRSRSHSRNRNFRHATNREKSSEKSDLCWYHRKFASRAKKCTPPCNFQGNFQGKK